MFKSRPLFFHPVCILRNMSSKKKSPKRIIGEKRAGSTDNAQTGNPEPGGVQGNDNGTPPRIPKVTLQLAPTKIRLAPIKIEKEVIRQEGVVIEHRFSSDGSILWSKIVTIIDNKYVTILEFKPKIKRALGSMISFDFTMFGEKRAVTNSATLVKESGLEDFFEQIGKEEKVQSIYISEICTDALSEKTDAIEILKKALGNKTIIGIDDSKIYYV